jgi:anion-transporting  ArsA/GET3 family ATPase
MTRVAVVCGVGGAGKTTLSAALGIRWAVEGSRVAVLTIDPARRLADALGIPHLGNDPVEVALPKGAQGTLHALMLDQKRTWDDMVRRFSPSREAADRLFENRYYRAASTRLTGSHEFMAIERLYGLVEEGRFDVVIVDTPPTRHVLDFFRAPERVGRLFEKRMVSTLTGGGSRSLIGSATRRGLRVVQRIAGRAVWEEVGEFFRLMSELAGGFKARSAAVAELLASDHSTFFLAADASAPERSDVLGFIKMLRDRDLAFSGFLLNRATLPMVAPPLPDTPPVGLSPEQWQAWSVALITLAQQHNDRALRHAKAAERLTIHSGGAPVYLVPAFQKGGTTRESLAALGPALPPAIS